MSDLLQTTITANGRNGDTYVFDIPSLHDEIKISARMKNIRKAIEPDWNTFDAIDGNGLYLLRVCATFEVLLRQSSATWPFSEGKTGPVVDSAKFPKERSSEVTAVYDDFVAKLTEFREGGPANKDGAGAKAVESQPNPGA
jgi:hypothetical protein